jgi:hypothetical protein
MRKIVVLEEAVEDIEQGRKFYDLQEIGVGDFFEDTILSDTESLGLFHGIHADILDSIACSRKDFRSESTTAKRPLPPRFLRFWIFAKIRFGFTRN